MERVESLRTENKFKKTEIGEIPVDWEVVKLGEVTQIIMGQSPPSNSYFEFVNGVPFFQGNAEFGSKFPKILKWCNSPRKLAETGDILISVRAPVGDVNIAPIECCIGRGLAALRGTKIHNDYLYFIINYFKDTLVKIGQGSTFDAINKRDVFELKIPFPTISEQKKIAEILTSVDEAIDKKQEIIEKTKMLKKGLMQELLTHGIGHKKFKTTEIGRIPADWEVVEIREISRVIRGASPRPIRDQKYFGDGYGWVRISDVTNSNIYLRETKDQLSNLGVSKSIIVKPGNLIMSICATIGKPVIVDMNACIHDGFVLFNDLSNLVDVYYLFYWLKKNESYFSNKGQYGTQKNLNTGIIKNTKISLPPLPEQKKIAEILTSVDEEIEKEMTQKVRIENIKKGLMQVLLTGKIRVKI